MRSKAQAHRIIGRLQSNSPWRSARQTEASRVFRLAFKLAAMHKADLTQSATHELQAARNVSADAIAAVLSCHRFGADMITSACLLGDVGGTNARFAVYDENRHMRHVRVMPVDDYATLREAIEAYLTAEGIGKPLRAAALAVASPVTGDAVTLTNHPWSFSISKLRGDLQVERLDDNQRFHGQRAGRPASEA